MATIDFIDNLRKETDDDNESACQETMSVQQGPPVGTRWYYTSTRFITTETTQPTGIRKRVSTIKNPYESAEVKWDKKDKLNFSSPERQIELGLKERL